MIESGVFLGHMVIGGAIVVGASAVAIGVVYCAAMVAAAYRSGLRAGER